MKLGMISQNLMQFEFEEGLKYAHDIGLQALEVGGIGLWSKKYLTLAIRSLMQS